MEAQMEQKDVARRSIGARSANHSAMQWMLHLVFAALGALLGRTELLFGVRPFGIALAAAWVGAKGVDFVSNQVAKAKAHEKLRGLYGQLIVKQNLIIDEYTKLSQEQAKEIARLTDDSTRAKENLEKIQKKLEEYSTLLQRITAFRKTVENPS